jgi:hypothetical protein
MRCIFCKRDSTGSRSEEHIIPESLGNREHVLPPGVVCDPCNNYFASSIEQVVLESGEFKSARFNMVIPNKRNRVPSVEAMLLPPQPGMTLSQAARFHRADVSRDVEDGSYVLSPDESAVAAVADGRIDRMIVPVSGSKPDQTVFARFLGKMAVEAMAARLLQNSPEMLDAFVQDDQIDILRNYARYGKQGLEWPYSERRIYPADFHFPTSDGGSYEVLHEFDFLPTKQGEMYFVVAILGMEYAINVAGPAMEGYALWLAEHGGRSPLYGKEDLQTTPEREE